ncbi:hypothetical protein OG558_24830 [Kribbella sp. NBC_01510]|uniref:hypothetical protein n=1 Tax=Kribbella sp. NBC_01510 TaxID=2903581 RepID=UPI00386936DF
MPRPPFWVGNASPVALRRAARAADGWFPSLIPAAEVAAGAARLADLADTPRVIAVGATGALGNEVASQRQIEESIRANYGYPATGVPITGGPRQAAERLAEFHQAGADHLVMGFSDSDWRTQCDLLADAATLL